MPFAHEYGGYNVEATLNQYIQDNLTAAGLPAWMPSARITYSRPKEGLISGHSGHAFSVDHLGADTIQMFQGRHVGAGEVGATKEGMMDISCWVSRQEAGHAYQQRLRQMGDMVQKLFASAVTVQLNDYYADIASPTNLTAVIRVSEAEQAPVTPDPNPDIERRRYLVTYNWLERASA